jgi:hypothetical protein
MLARFRTGDGLPILECVGRVGVPPSHSSVADEIFNGTLGVDDSI